MNATNHLRRASPVALFLVGSALFAAAYGVAPLYYSNQNQYFLHGLAAAGEGDLASDWLAGTADPTPAFSALVEFTARYLHPWFFYVYHVLFLGLYAASLFGLFAALSGRDAARRWPLFVALFVACHSALVRWLSQRLIGFDYPWFLQAGLAGQYVVGPFLQPSVFGAILLAGVCLFVRGHHLLAAACAGLVVGLHSTYLLPAALVTAGFLAALVRERKLRDALVVAAVALALALPAVVFVAARFGPTDPTTFARANDILVNVRIPHHARPDLWIDPVAAAQIAWVVLAVVLTLTRSRAGAAVTTPAAEGPAGRVFTVLTVTTVLAALLTLVQVATGSHTLALLFPWRVSVVLVPVATTVILTRLVGLWPDPAGPVARVASATAGAVLVGAGVWLMATGQGFQSDRAEEAVLEAVRQSHTPGDVYLIPVDLPDLVASTRGSVSSDFKPLAARKNDPALIPAGLMRFRLHTTAAIYVDFKSIPYKDREVVDWYERMQDALELQRALRDGEVAAVVPELRRRGITHVVWPTTRPLKHPELEVTHKDPTYRVYQLRAGEAGR